MRKNNRDDFDWEKFTDMDRDFIEEERQEIIRRHSRMVEEDD